MEPSGWSLLVISLLKLKRSMCSSTFALILSLPLPPSFCPLSPFPLFLHFPFFSPLPFFLLLLYGNSNWSVDRSRSCWQGLLHFVQACPGEGGKVCLPSSQGALMIGRSTRKGGPTNWWVSSAVPSKGPQDPVDWLRSPQLFDIPATLISHIRFTFATCPRFVQLLYPACSSCPHFPFYLPLLSSSPSKTMTDHRYSPT